HQCCRNSSIVQLRNSSVRLTVWTPTSHGWVVVNSDGARKSDTQLWYVVEVYFGQVEGNGLVVLQKGLVLAV
ncbi:hypothetical protein A2U01_0084240, partial [Trifolium medium]|nr:hypothetical protein [Trifolium medium]